LAKRWVSVIIGKHEKREKRIFRKEERKEKWEE
jgi:hypothetical protein